jgi:hypothetical protein
VGTGDPRMRGEAGQGPGRLRSAPNARRCDGGARSFLLLPPRAPFLDLSLEDMHASFILLAVGLLSGATAKFTQTPYLDQVRSRPHSGGTPNVD